MPDINNVYDTWAPQLIAKGLHPLPIGPGTKKPMVLKNGVFVGLPLWTQRGPIRTPQPGAGVGLLMGRNISAVDIDDDGEIGVAVLNALPTTPCRKTGLRGETLLYFAPGLPSKKYKINGKCVVEILGVGTQSVLPPSIHPDTHQPYRWTGSKTLNDIQEANELPFLFKDTIEALEKVLSTFGWAPEPEQHSNGNGAAGAAGSHPPTNGTDNPFRALNELALKKLPLWVPELGIHDCRRRVGQHPSYAAVAHWRASGKGRALEGRERNLKISPLGIEDFGDGRKYTPVDLVMAARGCTFKEAVAFLDDKLGWSTGAPEFKVDPTAASVEQEEAPAGPEPGIGKDDTAKNTGEAGDAKAKTGTAPGGSNRKIQFRLIKWQDMRPGVDPIYTVDELIPAVGLVLLWGKEKTFKSFWLTDLGFHVAMGWTYRDRAVQQGTVIYCAFEGGHGFKSRIEAQRRFYQIADDVEVPMYFMAGQAKLINDHKNLIADFKFQLSGVVPKLVVLDTLNRSIDGSESKDVDMTNYIHAAEVIRATFGCVVIIVHHCGYDDSHARGHTALVAAVDAELSIVRKEHSPLCEVAVKHMREGPEETKVVSRARIVPLDLDKNGRPRSSIVMVPADDEDVPSKAGRPDSATPACQAAVRLALTAHAVQFCPDGKPPVRAVEQEYVRKIFYRTYVDAEADKEKSARAKANAFSRAVKKLIADGIVRGQNTDKGTTMLWFAHEEDGCL